MYVVALISDENSPILYLAMEYCSGYTLDQYIAKHNMTEDVVRGLLKQFGMLLVSAFYL